MGLNRLDKERVRRIYKLWERIAGSSQNGEEDNGMKALFDILFLGGGCALSFFC